MRLNNLMARTGGDKTKQHILATAEKLFSRRGFDAAGVDLIARTAGVSKALIYYHFKDKNRLILSLFENIIEELEDHIEKSHGPDNPDDDAELKRKIREEVDFLAGRKRILSLMITEALKSDRRDDFLFRCAEIVMEREHGKQLTGRRTGNADQFLLAHEFFTGFIPLIAFVTFRDKWADYFNADTEKLVDHFIEAFARSHLASQKALSRRKR